MLIDTHCHLADARFSEDREAVVARARSGGVQHVILIADTADTTDRVREYAKTFGLSATAGVHPHEASSWNPEIRARIEAATQDPLVVAVGEAGLDYHYDHSPRDAQRRAFEAQLDLAAQRQLPIVIHAREADADMSAMLRAAECQLVLHSFSSGPEVLEVALAKGAYVSFSGMVTFRSWTDAHAVTSVPKDRLLVETDAPYLAPVPHRGKRNEPLFVRHVADRLAEMRQTTFDDVATVTTANAARCFGPRVLQPVSVPE